MSHNLRLCRAFKLTKKYAGFNGFALSAHVKTVGYICEKRHLKYLKVETPTYVNLHDSLTCYSKTLLRSEDNDSKQSMQTKRETGTPLQ